MTYRNATPITDEQGQELAKALGTGWTYKDTSESRYNPVARLYGSAGSVQWELFIRYDARGSADRMEISGVFTQEEYGHMRRYDSEKTPSITVAKDRPMAAIARDITRRLLADYAALKHTLQARINETRTYEQERGALLQRLLDAMPDNGRKSVNRDREADYYLSGGKADSVTLRAEPHSNSVALKLDGLTPDEAMAILRFVSNLLKSRQG